MTISLLRDHEDFLVLNKPPGVAVHRQEQTPGILDLLRGQYGYEPLWLVHRLDKDTSGLLVVAKHQQAASELSALFADRRVDKMYLALSDVKPKKKQGSVVGDMERSRRGGWRLSTAKNNPAVTAFHSRAVVPGLRCFSLYPKTGKTHQLRVMMKALGSPILGDVIYRKSDHASFDRLYLHATGIRFHYQQMDFEFWCAPKQGQHFAEHDWMPFMHWE